MEAKYVIIRDDTIVETVEDKVCKWLNKMAGVHIVNIVGIYHPTRRATDYTIFYLE